MPQHFSFFLPTHFFYFFLPHTCFLFSEVPYFDRGREVIHVLISRAFFIVYLNFLSWFLNPLKSCHNIKNSFQLFQTYVKFQLCIYLSPVLFFFFEFLVLLCMIIYILWYPFLYFIYLRILQISFSSLCFCTPYCFFKIIFPFIS